MFGYVKEKDKKTENVKERKRPFNRYNTQLKTALEKQTK